MLSLHNIGDGFKSLVREMIRNDNDVDGRRQLWPKADLMAYRKFVLRHEALIVVPERVKCNWRAAVLRQEGNRLYLAKRMDEAVARYNESLCLAEPGTEHLGMAYANRSAIYCEQGEYEYALANIALARQNHYPEKLLPKLAEREQKCRAQLAAGKSKGTVLLYHDLDINVPRNPKIPFVAAGIAMGRYPAFGGRGLVAERDFAPGDVILNERPMLTFLSSWGSFCNNCAGCFKGSLIPCSGCIRAMYCSEECLQEDYRYWHRFQCGFVDQLKHVEYGTSELAAKQFFYTLAAFGDNLDAMMTFCGSKGEDDPFTVDHTKEDRILEAMKVLHQAKPKQAMSDLVPIIRMSAAAYYAVFMKHPLLKQIVTNNVQKDFIVRTFYEYIFKKTILSLNNIDFSHLTHINIVSSISSLVNHSCDPNALSFLRYGRLRFWVIRPIRAGEQITVAYGPTWWDPVPSYESIYKCCCPVCDKNSDWVVREGTLPREALRKLGEPVPCGNTDEERDAKLLHQLLDLFVHYGQYHPDGVLRPKLQDIKRLIAGMIHAGAWTLERAQVAANI